MDDDIVDAGMALSVEVALAMGVASDSVLDGLSPSAWLAAWGFGGAAALMNLDFGLIVVEAMAGAVRSPDPHPIVSYSERSSL